MTGASVTRSDCTRAARIHVPQVRMLLLDRFFERHAETFEWVRPTASPIGFPRVTGVDNLARYCARLAEIGVLLLPGSVYDQPDHVRIGFGRANMPDALKLLEANLTGTQ